MHPIEDEARASAIAWLRAVTHDGAIEVSRDQLTEFTFQGHRLPLIDRGRGIRKPQGWHAALSITTAVPKSGRARPYEDDEGPDGLHRYKLRRDSRGSAENRALDAAHHDQVPLIWFYGVAPALFQAIFPVYLIAKEPELDQFVLALTEGQRHAGSPGSAVEAGLRRYLIGQTRQRLHQPLFASRVMIAYETHCAVCKLAQRPLLDAAHIIPDSLPGGDPVLANGLALCKIHHAAYDADVLGIRPDCVVEISDRLLRQQDGPMLRHGLQEHHGRRLMFLPRRIAERPDPARLEQRYTQFREVS